MLSDLSEVIRNVDKPLTEVSSITNQLTGRQFCLVQAQIKSYLLMLMKGVAHCHQNSIMHRVYDQLGLCVRMLEECMDFFKGLETCQPVAKFIWSLETG